ncbi:MAG: hypothetical protein J0L60_13615 [Ignavibacteria bacterium]|nr:hypothetical protein [Ignavibacteria bacterium]
MKKVALFLLSFVLAFVTVEIFLQYVIGFPTYGVEKKLIGIKSPSSGAQNIFKPYSSFFSVEGGLKIYKRNNLGFTGQDVDTLGNKKYIALLGNSYLQADQFSPEYTAAGILQQKLRNDSSGFEVLNLGVSGHDPLDLLYRVNYYSRTHKFEKVVLVIQDSQSAWLKRQSKIAFDRNLQVLHSNSLLTRILIPLRNNSVLIDLLAKIFNTKEEQEDTIAKKENTSKPEASAYDEAYDLKLKSIFQEYYKIFGERFVVVNIASSEQVSIPEKALQYLKENGVKYKFKPINLPENKISGKGHLNLQGNEKLGEVLYEVVR